MLQIAEKLRNVSKSRRRHGVSRSQFYEYERALQEKGFEGLMDRPPILKTFADETPDEVKEKVATPRTNGFVERFNPTILDEFFRETFRTEFYASVEEIHKDLDQWIHCYNHERPHRGYRNMGRRPIETIEQGKAVKRQITQKEAA